VAEEFALLAEDLKKNGVMKEVETAQLFNFTSLNVLWKIVTGKTVDRNDSNTVVKLLK